MPRRHYSPGYGDPGRRRDGSISPGCATRALPSWRDGLKTLSHSHAESASAHHAAEKQLGRCCGDVRAGRPLAPPSARVAYSSRQPDCRSRLRSVIAVVLPLHERGGAGVSTNSISQRKRITSRQILMRYEPAIYRLWFVCTLPFRSRAAPRDIPLGRGDGWSERRLRRQLTPARPR